MKTVLVVTTSEGAPSTRLLRAFTGASVFVARSQADAASTLRMVDVEGVVCECGGLGCDLAAFVSRVKEQRPTATVVAIDPVEEDADAADFTLPADWSQRDLDAVLRQVTERQQLLREIAILRTQIAPLAAGGAWTDAGREASALGPVLKEFTRVFAAGFDVRRVLELFLDALGQLLRPTRSALLMPDETRQAFRVAAHRGLAPAIVESARLSAGDGLGAWLAQQGRPARLQELADPALARELGMFAGVIAVPLLAHGELVAVLVVGQPVVGGGYSRQEMEILFDLASHLAMAIRDISLHEQVRQEKEFSERILAHMSSGVVTIGRDHRVGILNRRAEEILGLKAAEVVGRDLRHLPSPLGDMLFETLTGGQARPATEVHLALGNRWLEASTYPIRGDEPAPVAAVLVFEDRTAQKELAARTKQADQLQLLARVVARIADEIKNPLVSINTFVDLIDERYDDPDFRKLFSAVVRRDARRMVQVFEKLAGLVDEGALDFETVDAHAIVEDVITGVEMSDEGTPKRVQFDFTRDEGPLPVRVDPEQLRKALTYLVRYFMHHSPGEEARVALSLARHAERSGADTVRLLVSSRTAQVAAERLERLFDPVAMVQESSLIDVGPAVSQRLVEAQRGSLQLRQGRHELAFHVTLPAAAS